MKAFLVWIQTQSWFSLSLYLSIIFAILYGLITGFFSLMEHWAARNPAFKSRKIQNNDNKTAGVWHELFLSALNLCIIGMIGATIFKLSLNGHTGIYVNVDRYGWWYLPVSFGLAYLFQDFWFYWSHRLLHTSDFLMQKVHYIHHYSLRPRPTTALSFHPLEGLIIYIAFLWIAILIPMHWLLFFFFTIFVLAHDIWAHNGYEWLPKAWLQKGLFVRIFSTTTQHDLHHQPQGFRYNYGPYLLFGDWITGTLYPNYFDYLKKHFASIAKERS
jgi:sterol desaturase/sphingolipid hydroxylase (fatty acid hydroxylase superfamily)